MGKLITVVGNSGTGKTSLTRKLCEAGPFSPLLEQHQERPFQKQFSSDLKGYALANQIDYLLFRAKQEIYARQNGIIAVQDGGLEDFMNVEKTAVTNAANLAFFMANLSQLLLRRFQQTNPDFSILDLKAHYHGYRYALETVNYHRLWRWL